MSGVIRTFWRVAPKRVIAHLDCDAFYATVELIRRPELKGKPVIVAGSGPRAVVTTASYEARTFGVGSAMPASQARRLCPTAIVIPPDFTAYREKSREALAQSPELQSTLRQAIWASGPVRPGRREAAA